MHMLPLPPTFDKILAEKSAFYKRDLTVLDHVANKYIMTNTDWLAQFLFKHKESSNETLTIYQSILTNVF